MKDLVVRFGGESGEGVIAAGDLLTTVAARSSLHVLNVRTFPAEIRGGPSMIQVRIGHRPLLSQGDDLDILVALNEDAVTRYLADVKPGGLVLLDGEPGKEQSPREGREVVHVPMSRIAKDELKSPLAKNLVALGATVGLLGLRREGVLLLIKDKFKRRPELQAANAAAVEAGLAHGERLAARFNFGLPPAEAGSRKAVLGGNEAVGLGSLAAGMRFFAGYPITPASDIMEWLAGELPKVGGAMVQVEDEIAALNFVLGAFYAGTRSMTATSGPGLSLMVEAIGLAGMAEIPAVIVDVQRGGPSTGMPTKTEQSDLTLAAAASHGEPPVVVLAPTDIAETPLLMTHAFELAEVYQIPVIVLTDQSIGFRRQTVEADLLERLPVNGGRIGPLSHQAPFHRYSFSGDGVSPRAVPGDPGGVHTVTGLEHTTTGKPTFEPTDRVAMVRKRFLKLEHIARDFGPRGLLLEGDEDAELAVVGWGATYGAVREAVEIVRGEGRKVRLVYFKMLRPFPEKTGEILGRYRRLLVVENNATGQLVQLLRASHDIHPALLARFDGTPFTPASVRAGIMEVLKS